MKMNMKWIKKLWKNIQVTGLASRRPQWAKYHMLTLFFASDFTNFLY